jgi:hypothetical protein
LNAEINNQARAVDRLIKGNEAPIFEKELKTIYSGGGRVWPITPSFKEKNDVAHCHWRLST